MGRNTKAAVSEAADSTSTAEDPTLRAPVRMWPAAIAVRATREATDIEIAAGAEFQQIKAELRTNFE